MSVCNQLAVQPSLVHGSWRIPLFEANAKKSESLTVGVWFVMGLPHYTWIPKSISMICPKIKEWWLHCDHCEQDKPLYSLVYIYINIYLQYVYIYIYCSQSIFFLVYRCLQYMYIVCIYIWYIQYTYIFFYSVPIYMYIQLLQYIYICSIHMFLLFIVYIYT